jgi:chromate transporter
MKILFFVFFKIGFVAFGGGWSAVGIMRQEILAHHFLTPLEFYQMISALELVPGPVALKIATFTGYKVEGLKGAIVTSLGFILPATIIFTLVYSIGKYVKIDRKKFMDSLKLMTAALASITLFFMAKDVYTNIGVMGISVVAFIIFLRTKLFPIFIIFGAGILGLLLF